MTISDSFTSEHVGFVPVGIRLGSPEHFPVDPALGNVALAWKYLSPAVPVTVLHPVPVEEELGEVIFYVDVHCLAAFDEGIEECGNFRIGLGNAEKEGLSSYHKGSYHILGGICEISHKPPWDCGQKPRLFLRRKRGLAKYTKEQKQKAIDLYIRYCKQATRVIKELGYPNKRHTLVSWYRGYEEKGEVKDDGREEKKLSLVYSEDQIHAAVSFYVEHGKSLSKTIETLGYPHGTRTLKEWVEKLAKEELVQRDYGDTQKRYCTEDVAKALCSSQVRGKASVAEIAKRHGVSRSSIYHIKTKLKDNGYDFNMDKGHNELPQEIKEPTEEAVQFSV